MATPSPTLRKLTPRKLDFCREYVEGPPVAQRAALAVGFAYTTARTKAFKWLADESVKAEITRLREAKIARLERSGDDVIRALWAVVDSDPESALAVSALNTLAKTYGLTDKALVVNVDNRQQFAGYSNEELARIASQASPRLEAPKG